MPSSTSNSNFPHHRAPIQNWYVLWGLSLAFVFVFIGGAEAFWRSRGIHPSVSDSPRYWSFYRAQVSNNNRDQVVLLGASRVAGGFSTDVFRREFPDYDLTQLAISGCSPVAALRDLADEERFRGVVICGMRAQYFQRQRWDDQQPYVAFYRGRYTFQHAIDSVIVSFLQERFVILSRQTRFQSVIHKFLTDHSLPESTYSVRRSDRSQHANFSLASNEALNQFGPEDENDLYEFPAPVEWMKDVRNVEQFVREIEDHGGRVIFVRFPTDGDYWVVDQKCIPKDKYWDRMAAFTSAETIHFADYPSLSRFELPDTSHLDGKDAPAFTAALLEVLVRRGVLPDHDEE